MTHKKFEIDRTKSLFDQFLALTNERIYLNGKLFCVDQVMFLVLVINSTLSVPEHIPIPQKEIDKIF